jgi:hypothetical protein
MKLQIRTKDNLVELLKKGISHAWRVNKGRLNSITEVEIYDFNGKAKISGTFDRENSQILENGRVAVAFKDAKIEQADYKWVGQNPIKYQSATNEEVELMDDEIEEVNESDANNFSSFSIENVDFTVFNEFLEFKNFIENLEFNPSYNAKAIIKGNPKPDCLITVLELYLQSLLDKFNHHEDAFRDFCLPLTDSNSYFEEFFGPAFQFDTGEEYVSDPDDDFYEEITFDALKAFFKETSNISEDKQKEFAYAMIQCFTKDEDDDISIPDDLLDNFDDYMIEKLEFAAEKLVG